MSEQDLLKRLASVQTMPELDAMRVEVAETMTSDGTRETFERVQQAFIKAKDRLRRIPLRDRTW